MVCVMLKNNNKNNIYGFTLIELSIVLIIISLIVGGIVGGKSLIRSAEIQSVVKDIGSIKTALNTFTDQYDSLPGDFLNAYDYFDGSGGNSICGANTDSTDFGGCNGNANNQLAGRAEQIRGWQHLQLAEIFNSVEIEVSLGGRYVVGYNLPTSDVKTAGYNVGYATNVYQKKYGNNIHFATDFDNGNNFAGGVITAREAKTLDKKMDDGEADNGNIYSTNSWGSGGCTTQGYSNPAPSTYTLDSNTNTCRMYFWLE